jgi:hypothetical protein
MRLGVREPIGVVGLASSAAAGPGARYERTPEAQEMRWSTEQPRKS